MLSRISEIILETFSQKRYAVCHMMGSDVSRYVKLLKIDLHSLPDSFMAKRPNEIENVFDVPDFFYITNVP